MRRLPALAWQLPRVRPEAHQLHLSRAKAASLRLSGWPRVLRSSEPILRDPATTSSKTIFAAQWRISKAEGLALNSPEKSRRRAALWRRHIKAIECLGIEEKPKIRNPSSPSLELSLRRDRFSGRFAAPQAFPAAANSKSPTSTLLHRRKQLTYDIQLKACGPTKAILSRSPLQHPLA